MAGRKLPPVDFRPRSPLASRARSGSQPDLRPDLTTNARIAQLSFTRVILPSSVLSRCSSRHLGSRSSADGCITTLLASRQCRQTRALHEQMSASFYAPGATRSLHAFSGNGCFSSGQSTADWNRRTIRTFRGNRRSFRSLASCDIAPVWQRAAAPIYCVAISAFSPYSE